MEKEHAIISDDGRIQQKETPFFQGKELAHVAPEAIDEAVSYFEKQFSALEKYVSASLKVITAGEKSENTSEKLEQLRNEVILAKAIGDFTELMNRIDSATTEIRGSQEGPESEDRPTDSEPERGMESVSQKESVADDEAGQPDEEKTKEKQDIPVKEDRPEVEYAESLSGLAEMTSKAWDLANQSDWQSAQLELENLRLKWDELVAADESLTAEAGYEELMEERRAAEAHFVKRKAAWQDKRKERKSANFEKRQRLLEQLQEVVDKKKWQAIKQVNAITSRWDEIRDLPGGSETADQDKRFADLVSQFNENKVAFLVKKAQKEEENLAGKLAVLDKMTQIVESLGPDTTNWDQFDSEMEELSRQWRKIGHVPLEQSDRIWEQFKGIRDEYFNKKYELNEAFRNQTLKNIRKKTRLCENAEALVEEEDLAFAVREMNNLHKKWKKIGPIPKEKNDELWDRFNAATKKFNELKSDNQDTIRKQEQENQEKKIALCEKAEALQDSTNWNEVSRELEELMKTWKEIGPVPRRKSGKIWKRFKKALDTFYNNRRKHYREVREEQKLNYEKKREIVSELDKLGEHENAEEAVAKARELQEQFKSIGFVPIKKKAKLDKDYKAVCDKIYQRVRSTGGGSGKPGRQSDHVPPNKSARDEYFRLKKECDKLQEEILRYKDTITFINPGGKGNALIDDVQKKIDKAQNNLDEKLEKLEELRMKMEE